MREWYELKFSYEFRSKFGTEFQDFFTSIMERGYPADFQKVKPYGNKGDKKCDGYQQSVKRVYQVYAPEKMLVKETNDKIVEDHAGAIAHWKESMTTWVFMHNQWRGVPAESRLQPDGHDCGTRLLVGERDHEPISEEPRPADARVRARSASAMAAKTLSQSSRAG